MFAEKTFHKPWVYDSYNILSFSAVKVLFDFLVIFPLCFEH